MPNSYSAQQMLTDKRLYTSEESYIAANGKSTPTEPGNFKQATRYIEVKFSLQD